MAFSWEISADTFWLIHFFSASEIATFLSWILRACFYNRWASSCCWIFDTIWWWWYAFFSCWEVSAWTLWLFHIFSTSYDTFLLIWILRACFYDRWNIKNFRWIRTNVCWIIHSFISLSNCFLESCLNSELSRFGCENFFIIILSWLKGYEHIPVIWEEVFLWKQGVWIHSNILRSSFGPIDPLTIFLSDDVNSSSEAQRFNSNC